MHHQQVKVVQRNRLLGGALSVQTIANLMATEHHHCAAANEGNQLAVLVPHQQRVIAVQRHRLLGGAVSERREAPKQFERQHVWMGFWWWVARCGVPNAQCCSLPSNGHGCVQKHQQQEQHPQQQQGRCFIAVPPHTDRPCRVFAAPSAMLLPLPLLQMNYNNKNNLVGALLVAGYDKHNGGQVQAACIKSSNSNSNSSYDAHEHQQQQQHQQSQL
jgi:hypothetical protein